MGFFCWCDKSIIIFHCTAQDFAHPPHFGTDGFLAGFPGEVKGLVERLGFVEGQLYGKPASIIW
jgi:hypothetical protein